jgi:hypothetical protein
LGTVILPSIGVYIITSLVIFNPITTTLTNLSAYTTLTYSATNILIVSSTAYNYCTSLPSSAYITFNNTTIYNASTTSNLTLNVMLQRVILSGGSGSGTSLNLQYTLSYVRIG